MLAALKKLTSYPPKTLVYPGHEYTLKNLAFALSVEPSNARLKEKHEKWTHAKQICTVPSTVQEELDTNPFVRVHAPEIQASTGESDPVQVMAVLRERKNNFK